MQKATTLVGQSTAFLDAVERASQAAALTRPVLVIGERGTGKELIAERLHHLSPRWDGPLVTLNCAALPENLIDAELFGYEAGAFTGAQKSRAGRFEDADGGTLFLDEIGDMPLELQTRLLRVLSDGQFYRVGGHQPLKANVRVIAATHQNLEQRVREGTFREDLFHRLNVIRLRLPALRERREDIPELTRFFLAKSANDLGVDTKRITVDALQRLQAFDFPGNVRQLENICHWLTVMAPGQVIESKDLPPELDAGASSDRSAQVSLEPSIGAPSDIASAVLPAAAAQQAPPLPTAADMVWLDSLQAEARQLLEHGAADVWERLTRQFERRLIETALAATRGRRIEAARKLGIGRNTITRKIQDLDLDK